jgi:hypothetical protein
MTCSYSAEAIVANDPSGSFNISVLDKRITVNAQSNWWTLSPQQQEASTVQFVDLTLTTLLLGDQADIFEH